MVTIDRYRLIREIARGGQGRIYLCYDPKMEQRVVVKVIEDSLGSPKAGLSFAREANALRKLDHPNIVRLYDFKNDGGAGIKYLVMEYVEGRSLAERLRADGALPPQEAIDMALDICAALGAIHTRGIVHKDIKPSNILLTEGGRAKLSDFGISSGSEDPTSTGERVGTVRYMAPELSASSDAADARSDLYSLGVTLYEALIGRAPFDGNDAVSISKKHLFEVPPAPRSLDRGIPVRLSDAVMKLLEKSPEARYQTAEELAWDLRIARGNSRNRIRVGFLQRRAIGAGK